MNFSWDGTERMASHPPLTLRINDQKTVAAVAREEGTSAELHGITFRWDSDDERVATVSQSIGPQTVVTARGPGRTRIHVGCDREVNDIDLEVLPQ